MGAMEDTRGVLGAGLGVMAMAVVVGIAGFVIALIRPVFVASIGTAVLGGWMLMACGAVLWATGLPFESVT